MCFLCKPANLSWRLRTHTTEEENGLGQLSSGPHTCAATPTPTKYRNDGKKREREEESLDPWVSLFLDVCFSGEIPTAAYIQGQLLLMPHWKDSLNFLVKSWGGAPFRSGHPWPPPPPGHVHTHRGPTTATMRAPVYYWESASVTSPSSVPKPRRIHNSFGNTVSLSGSRLACHQTDLCACVREFRVG